ncbi:MAG TPA: hypothetical protein VGH19_21485 [Verrucomicrobiae bacterium]
MKRLLWRLRWLLFFGLLIGGWQVQAQTKPVQLTERVVSLSAALQPSRESAFTLAGFNWFYVGGVVPGKGQSVVQAFDTDGAPQQEYLLPPGQTIYALHVLDDGALWALTRKDETGWRLVKFNFAGPLLQDLPLVFPKGFEIPAPAGKARLHLVPGQNDREVHGVYFVPGAQAVFKTFTLSTYGVVKSANSEGFKDRDGFTHRLTTRPGVDGKDSLGITWKRSFYLLSEPHYAVDLWGDQVIVQTSDDDSQGQSYLLALNDFRPMWREPLKFPLRNNSYTFYHYNLTTRKVTLYPYLDALMGTGWRVPSSKRGTPLVPKKQGV